MSVSSALQPRVAGSRTRVAADDVLLVQRASALIRELGADLDDQLEREARTAERLRLVREATNRITPAANDAVHAYRKAHRSLNTELERANGNVESALEMRSKLRAARLDLLDALEQASRRYPWADGPPRTAARGTRRPR